MSTSTYSKALRFLKQDNALAVALFSLLAIFIALPLISKLFAPPSLSAFHAENFTYPSQWTQSRSLTLHNGVFTGDPDSPGLESRLHVELYGFAQGNIDATGGGDVAAILVSTLVSGRTYYDMHVLLEHEGKAVHAGNVYIGDRSNPDCLIINKPGIQLRKLTRQSSPGLSVQHYTPVTEYFEIRNGQLIQVNSL